MHMQKYRCLPLWEMATKGPKVEDRMTAPSKKLTHFNSRMLTNCGPVRCYACHVTNGKVEEKAEDTGRVDL